MSKKNVFFGAIAVFSFILMGTLWPVQADATSLWERPNEAKTLALFNTHTRENLEVTYWQNDRYDPAALENINNHLRDHRSGTQTNMSRDTLNLLHDIKKELQARHPGKEITFHIISGYRSPKTNAMLRANGGGQAKKSRHMHGDAIDIRVPGVSSAEIRDVAWCLQRGGVGYYKGSDFVHVDTHTVRHWNWAPKSGMCRDGSNS